MNAQASDHRPPPPVSSGLLRWSRRGLIVVLVLHAGLWIFGVVHPEALLKADRGEARYRHARAVIESFSAGEPLGDIIHGGVIGDYGWHALLLAICGGWLPGVVAVQLLLQALSLWMLYKLARYLGYDSSVAMLAVLVYAIIPVDMMQPHTLTAESIYIPLAIAHVTLLVRYIVIGQDLRVLIASGLCYSSAAVTRPEIIAWLPVAAALLAWVAWKGARLAAWGRVPLFVACCAALPAAWICFQGVQTGEYGFGRSGHDVGTTVRLRVDQILAAAGDEQPYTDEQRRSLATLATLAGRHPGAYAKIVASHAAKWVLFPGNLQVESYLGIYEPTGKRSMLVHQQGWGGALKAVFTEMPLLTIWLLLQMALFVMFWVLVARGVFFALRSTRGAVWLGHLLILMWPTMYFGLLLIVEGNSRKRSPADFALAIFAAVAIALWLGRRPTWGTTPDAPAQG